MVSKISNFLGARLDGHHLKLGLFLKKIEKRLRNIIIGGAVREFSKLDVNRTLKTTRDPHLEGKVGKGKGPKRGTP